MLATWIPAQRAIWGETFHKCASARAASVKARFSVAGPFSAMAIGTPRATMGVSRRARPRFFCITESALSKICLGFSIGKAVKSFLAIFLFSFAHLFKTPVILEEIQWCTYRREKIPAPPREVLYACSGSPCSLGLKSLTEAGLKTSGARPFAIGARRQIVFSAQLAVRSPSRHRLFGFRVIGFRIIGCPPGGFAG